MTHARHVFARARRPASAAPLQGSRPLFWQNCSSGLTGEPLSQGSPFQEAGPRMDALPDRVRNFACKEVPYTVRMKSGV